MDDFENALFGLDARLAGSPMVRWHGTDARRGLAFWRSRGSVRPGATDPVLFVAPAYSGRFPEALQRLEVRRLVPGGVEVHEPRDQDVMAGMRWAEMLD